MLGKRKYLFGKRQGARQPVFPKGDGTPTVEESLCSRSFHSFRSLVFPSQSCRFFDSGKQFLRAAFSCLQQVQTCWIGRLDKCLRFLKLRSKMLQCLRKSALKNSKKTNIRQHAESYHSYPDPTEVPEVSSTVSSFKKTCDKSSNGFSIDQKFRLDRSFTSTQTKSAPGNRSRPEPASTTISNGIVVSSIDTPGLMTSFSLLVQTGR